MTTPPGACRVERLRLFRFRNYADETVELGPGLNVVAGSNAQGKTNLLEAVATVSLARSPRAPTLAELLAWGEPACRVEARVAGGGAVRAVSLTIRRTAVEGAVRTITVDGSPRSARGLLGLCPVVLFWPEDLQLVKGGPEGRRRLLDIALSQVDARVAADLVRYRRVLDQRNALLRAVRSGASGTAGLEAFTVELARTGGVVRAARRELCDALAPLATAALADLSGGDEVLDMRYLARAGDAEDADLVLGGGDGLDQAVEAPEGGSADDEARRLLEELNARRGEELARGVTVTGPHRDDVMFLLDGRPARTTASQGQQRSVVLACKLAEVRHLATRAGLSPVLLLDDVLSELDAERRHRLLSALGADRGGVQVIITTSETALDVGAPARRLLVHAGRVLRVEETAA